MYLFRVNVGTDPRTDQPFQEGPDKNRERLEDRVSELRVKGSRPGSSVKFQAQCGGH